MLLNHQLTHREQQKKDNDGPPIAVQIFIGLAIVAGAFAFYMMDDIVIFCLKMFY